MIRQNKRWGRGGGGGGEGEGGSAVGEGGGGEGVEFIRGWRSQDSHSTNKTKNTNK